MNLNFDKYTLSILYKSGWYLNRYINIDDDIKLLNCNGFYPGQLIRQFLHNFGNLTITHSHAKVKTINDYFHFDINKAIYGVDISWILEEYSDRCKTPLCIIGEAYRRQLILCMSNNGEIYAGIDDILYVVGNNIETSIVTLINGYDLIELY